MEKQSNQGMGFALISTMHKLSSYPLPLKAMRRNLDEARSSWHNRCVVDIGRTARIRAWLECSSHRLHLLRACLEQEGGIRATASGKFLQLPTDQQSEKHGGTDG